MKSRCVKEFRKIILHKRHLSIRYLKRSKEWKFYKTKKPWVKKFNKKLKLQKTKNNKQKKSITFYKINIRQRRKWWDRWLNNKQTKPNKKNYNNLKREKIELDSRCKKKCKRKIKCVKVMNKVFKKWKRKNLTLFRN